MESHGSPKKARHGTRGVVILSPGSFTAAGSHNAKDLCSSTALLRSSVAVDAAGYAQHGWKRQQNAEVLRVMVAAAPEHAGLRMTDLR